MTTAEKNESLINKINKLLALAMDSGATEHERKVAQERADELMARNAIDRMDLTVEEKGKIVVEEFKISVLDSGFREHLAELMARIVIHANCKAVRGFGLNPTYKIVGFPEDIQYAKRLWLVAFSEMASRINPQWGDDLSFDTNVYRFVKAGWKWSEIEAVAIKHGGTPKSSWLANAYKRECKRLGEALEKKTTRHLAYRTSYVQGFVSEITRKLEDMRTKTQETVGDNDRFALALRSTKEQVEEEFYLLFPQFKPVSQEETDEYWRKQRLAEQLRLSKMTPKQREQERIRKERERDRLLRNYNNRRNSSYDPNGWSAGSAAGKNVDLSDSTKVKTETDRKKLS